MGEPDVDLHEPLDEAEIESAGIPNDREDESDLEGLDAPETFEAVVASTDWTSETILSQIERNRLVLDPDFQRRDAWTRARKSRFIESLIANVPIPQIVLAERKNQRGSYVVIDGKQRLLTLWQFAGRGNEDGRGFALRGLELRTDLNGMRLDDLPARDRDALETQTIRTVVVRNWQRDDFLYLVFLRLNTENSALSPQELRQALHPGAFVKFVNDFTAESEVFHRVLRRKTPDFRMRDVELLVRYFAFTRFLPTHNGNLKPLLDTTCETLNDEWSRDEASIRASAESCVNAISAIFAVFGEQAFRRWNSDHFERPFNRAVFDVMTFYADDPGVSDRMVAASPEVVEAFKTACHNSDFVESISTTTKSIDNIQFRLAYWGEALQSVLGGSLPVPYIDEEGRIAYS